MLLCLHLDYWFCWAHLGTRLHFVHVLSLGRGLGVIQGRLSGALADAGLGNVDLAGLDKVEVLLIEAIGVGDRLVFLFGWGGLLSAEVVVFGLGFLSLMSKLVVLLVELL